MPGSFRFPSEKTNGFTGQGLFSDEAKPEDSISAIYPPFPLSPRINLKLSPVSPWGFWQELNDYNNAEF